MAETRNFVGKHLRYPDLTGKRLVEAGRRTKNDLSTSRPNAPLVTVITVCWNAGATIEQAVKSVLGQSYDNIEYLVLDGASTDSTLDILARDQDQIDYLLSEPDDGIYPAMNKGLELARGDFILFLNADDWYTPRCVEKLVDAYRTADVDFVSARANYMREDGSFIRVQPRAPFDAGVDFRMPLRHETMLVPADLYEREGGYDTSYQIIADRVKTASLYWKGYSHFELQDPLLNFRMSGVSSTRIDKLHAERRRVLVERYPGMADDAIDALMALESLTPQILCDIAREYKSGAFRSAALAYAKSLEAVGQRGWSPINPAAFDRGAAPARVLSRADPAPAPEGPAPRVSVILPVYNAQHTLGECFDAILGQTLQDFEIIVLNDQSPDDSQSVIDTYAAREQRIRAMKNAVNLGLGSTRNRGIAAARGDYIFHIDPDDTLPKTALETLVIHADRYGSDMTRGAFRHEQLLFGQESKAVRKGMVEPGAPHIVNTTVSETPEFLRSTEGHWSYLYRRDFATRVFYPEDLKMGQDSIFLVQALAAARSISVIDAEVYTYRANAQSAMNTYTVRKVMDEVEWRRRAWHALNAAGHREQGNHLLFDYWNVPFFDALEKICSPEEYRGFWAALEEAFAEAGNADAARGKNPKFREIIQTGLRRQADAIAAEKAAEAKAADTGEALRIEILSTSDTGGAGIAARRLLELLRASGHDARLACVFPGSGHPKSYRAPLIPEAAATLPNDAGLRDVWRKHGVLTPDDLPGLKAREMFSKTGSVVPLAEMNSSLKEADVVHLHWISGMLDFEALPEILGDKPVVWTLHDMNAFTGGCHYAEGCDGYRNACQNCPLLDGDPLAHEQWKTKRDAISRLKNLQIVCPSAWLADCARKSSIFEGREVHVVPNYIPVDQFTPINKLLARRELGLPLDAKLVAFGADSLSNRRKGGDILVEAMKVLAGRGLATGVEGVFFGADRLDLPLPVHNVGYIDDPRKLSLVYAAADVFAFPSREDNAPQTVPEALLSGTPVVAFPVGNVPNLVRHLKTGFVARYEDAEHFAEGLAWALKRETDDAENALMRGIAAHVDTRRAHDPDITLTGHVALYRAMTEGPLSGTNSGTEPGQSEQAVAN
ncbi:glycosyltransferase [Primorskyibacter aestuariivivens]|uniref:glycosyltransferase n=1 Tax=Primorskyibacter aestuariivivens TaxID=1888912 RepID=UPI0023005926|nr:glycosyltransferase [Primorskyibacter aestuariivivens]MDA7429612.1 glycosyltransferase [Primorskyibacter aestuariivivens]